MITYLLSKYQWGYDQHVIPLLYHCYNRVIYQHMLIILSCDYKNNDMKLNHREHSCTSWDCVKYQIIL